MAFCVVNKNSNSVVLSENMTTAFFSLQLEKSPFFGGSRLTLLETFENNRKNTGNHKKNENNHLIKMLISTQ